jgi:transposase
MTSPVYGIDISKRDFHLSLLKESRATKPKKFTNNIQGFESLHNWLQQLSCRRTPCEHMEATSIYGEALAEFLYGAGFFVSIVKESSN